MPSSLFLALFALLPFEREWATNVVVVNLRNSGKISNEHFRTFIIYKYPPFTHSRQYAYVRRERSLSRAATALSIETRCVLLVNRSNDRKKKRPKANGAHKWKRTWFFLRLLFSSLFLSLEPMNGETRWVRREREEERERERQTHF